jgi:chemotaxis protein CheD
MPASTTPPAWFTQRVVVGVGDMGVSNNPAITLSTYALGSCVAVVAFDPAIRAGGLLHVMLPESSISPAKAATQPAMFVDTGMPLLMRALAGLKADPMRLRIFLAGGASVLCGNDSFKIGERNIRATADYVARYRLCVRHSALGGTINRTVHLNVSTGAITMKTPEGESSCSLAV